MGSNGYNDGMDIGKTLRIKNREEWHQWLETHFATEKEIWLVLPGKDSGQTRIPYNDTVEEALCFGWIDSTIKKIDATSTAQRFTPRNPGTAYSQANKERLRWLVKENKIHPSILDSVKKALEEEFAFPPDIMAELRKNKQAWAHYQNFSPAYRRIRVAYIDSARNRPEEFRKRLDNFIKKTEQNKTIGYGGIEKYY